MLLFKSRSDGSARHLAGAHANALPRDEPSV